MVRVPTRAEIEEIQRRIPGTIVLPQVQEGTRLSDLPEQDSYSYAVAYVPHGREAPVYAATQLRPRLEPSEFAFRDVVD